MTSSKCSYFLIPYCHLVNGNWGKWSIYSNCSRKCGGGEQIKSRLCIRPSPSNGGLQCLKTNGNSSEITDRVTEENVSRTCNTNPCPGNIIPYISIVMYIRPRKHGTIYFFIIILFTFFYSLRGIIP